MRFLFITTWFLGTLTVYAGASETITLKDLGPSNIPKKEILSKIFADQSKWSAYLAKIESGQNEWVKTWPAMRKVADGGASEQLDISMYKLLESNATVVLQTIKKSWNNPVEANGIAKKVCEKAGEDLQENSSLEPAQEKARAISGIQERRKKINEVSNKDLSDLKSTCLSSLQESESFWIKK